MEDEFYVTAEKASSVEEAALLDPLHTGFSWYLPSRSLSDEHFDGGGGGIGWTVSGHDMQVLTMTVPPGREVVTEVGSFMFMHPRMTSNVELTLCGGENCGEGCGRILGGESCVKVLLRNDAPEHVVGYVGVTPNFPAKIIPIQFGTTGDRIDTALIAKPGAVMTQIGEDVRVGFDLDCGMRTCCCAGLGLCRQKISSDNNNDGIAFLAAGGTILYKNLGNHETIVVDGTSIMAYEDTVQMGITFSGGGCMCCLGEEGMFNTTLTGPGKVWIQSMNFNKFRSAVQRVEMERNDQTHK